MAQADPNITYEAGPTYELYRITYPMPGEWTLLVEEVDVPPGGVEYVARVNGYTDVSMTMALDGQQQPRGAFVPGDPILVSAAVLGEAGPVTGASVLVEIAMPGGVDELALFDDGLHQDGAPDDGVYANTFANTHDQGAYQFVAEASFVANDEQVRRQRAISAVVVDVSAVGPNAPIVEGPTEIYEGEDHSYSAVADHPGGEQMYYLFDWGDGTSSDWIGPYGSGEMCTAAHSWQDCKVHLVRAIARDDWGYSSEWSNGLPVVVSAVAPSAIQPSGPRVGFVEVSHSYTTGVSGSVDEEVYYQFSWGDETYSDWLGPYAPDEPCTAADAWAVPSTYDVRARASFGGGQVGDWSGALHVCIGSEDANGNGVPDECEPRPVPPSDVEPAEPASPAEVQPAP